MTTKKPLRKTAKTPEQKPAETPEAQPEVTEEATASGSSNSTIEDVQGDTPDFEAIAKEFEAPPEPEVDATGETVEVENLTSNGFYTKEAFRKGASTTFQMAGGITGLQTLLQSPDSPSYPDAMNALYDTIVDCPSLHFLIQPQGIWMQRAAAVGAFAVPVALGCAGEIKARKAERLKTAANDNNPLKGEQSFKEGPEVMEETHGPQGGVNEGPEIMTEQVAA